MLFLFCLFVCLSCRSGLFTDILLVLVVSITCVQTKEIKNSSDFQEKISATTNHSSIANSSITDPSFNKHAPDNRTWSHQFIDILTTINTTKIDTDNKHDILTNKNDNFNAQLPHSKYSITKNGDQIEISNDNELNKSELPTPIEIEFHSNTVQTKQTTERNGKESNILRSALRVAARQGLEAMVELYDKREPNLMRKGL